MTDEIFDFEFLVKVFAKLLLFAKVKKMQEAFRSECDDLSDEMSK